MAFTDNDSSQETGQGFAQSGGGTRAPIDARRTLVIGLGSTGTRVCNQILDRINAVYRSPKNLPWLRCVCLETLPVKSSLPVRQEAQFLHLAIEPSEYSMLLRQPTTYDTNLDFSKWDIPALTSTADQLKDGANNMRILGRLALLFPRNFLAVRDAIVAELSRLSALDSDTARDAFRQGQPQANAAEIPVILSKNIYVYVVGTLAGGTASGSFIDMGYLLQRLPGHTLTTTAILHLPAADHTNKTHIGNTMAALIELNHFNSPESCYEAQTADMPGKAFRADRGRRPFDHQYLIQTRHNLPQEYARLITISADYVFADLIGGSSGARDGDRTNLTGQMKSEDPFGAPQKFMTFGLSAIEFPYQKVRRACTMRLMAHGIRLTLGRDAETDAGTGGTIGLAERGFDSMLEKTTPLAMRENLENLLLAVGENDTVRARLRATVEASRDAGLESDAALSRLRQQIEAAFATTDGEIAVTMPDNLTPRIVSKTVAVNILPAIDKLILQIRTAVGDLLLAETTATVPMLIDYLEKMDNHLSKEMETPSDGTAARTRDLLNHQRNAQACRTDDILKFTLVQKPATEFYVRRFFNTQEGLIAERLQIACAPAVADIYGRAQAWIRVMRERMTNEGTGLRARLVALAAALQSEEKAINSPVGLAPDGWGRVVNGPELYHAPDDLDGEYSWAIEESARAENLPGRQAEREEHFALRSVREVLREGMAGLVRPVNEQSPLDRNSGTPAVWNSDSLRTVSTAANTVFEPLAGRSVLERWANRGDKASLLKDAVEKSGWMLDFTEGGGRFTPADNKKNNYVFFRERDKGAEDLSKMLKGVDYTSLRIKQVNWDDPHQILILQELGAFSLGSVQTTDDIAGTAWWNRYRQPELVLRGSTAEAAVDTLHARGDVPDWITWERNRKEAGAKAKRLFLIAVALEAIRMESIDRYLFARNGQETVVFGRELRDAAAKMKKVHQSLHGSQETVADDMAQEIDQKRAALGPSGVVQKLQGFAKNFSSHFTEGGTPLKPDELKSFVRDYITADVDLKREMEKIERNFSDESFLDPQPDDSGRQPYRCPVQICPMLKDERAINPAIKGKVLGYSSDALYQNVEQSGGVTRRVRKCALCETNFEGVSGGQNTPTDNAGGATSAPPPPSGTGGADWMGG